MKNNQLFLTDKVKLILERECNGFENRKKTKEILKLLKFEDNDHNCYRVRCIIKALRNQGYCYLNAGDGYYIPKNDKELALSIEYIALKMIKLKHQGILFIKNAQDIIEIPENFYKRYSLPNLNRLSLKESETNE